MQRRLGYVELARGRLERAAFGDRGERADVRIGDLDLDRSRGLAARQRRADGGIAQRRLDAREQSLDARQQDGSEWRQIGAGAPALQQVDRERGLDLRHHLRHGRLRQAELARGSADAHVAGDRGEGTKLTQ